MSSFAMLLALSMLGCAYQPGRVSFSCVSYPHDGKVLTDCADEKTWAEWIEQQKAKNTAGDI